MSLSSTNEYHNHDDFKSDPDKSYVDPGKSTGSEISNQLKFEEGVMMCERCNMTFTTCDTAREHEKNRKHGKCIYIPKLAQYQCKICKSNILCSRDIICHHLA
jgi:hypothetical protein